MDSRRSTPLVDQKTFTDIKASDEKYNEDLFEFDDEENGADGEMDEHVCFDHRDYLSGSS